MPSTTMENWQIVMYGLAIFLSGLWIGINFSREIKGENRGYITVILFFAWLAIYFFLLSNKQYRWLTGIPWLTPQ